MSWSFNSQGPAKVVLEQANREFVAFKCVEPEQTARMSCHSILQNLLTAWPAGVDVRVEMGGSQAARDPGITNELHVKIGVAS